MNDKLLTILSTFIAVCIVGFVVIIAAVVGLSGGGSSSYSGGSSSYNDSVPSGMTQYESNYIGNTAAENGYNEEEAKEIRDAIHKFNQLQD